MQPVGQALRAWNSSLATGVRPRGPTALGRIAKITKTVREVCASANAAPLPADKTRPVQTLWRAAQQWAKAAASAHVDPAWRTVRKTGSVISTVNQAMAAASKSRNRTQLGSNAKGMPTVALAQRPVYKVETGFSVAVLV